MHHDLNPIIARIHRYGNHEVRARLLTAASRIYGKRVVVYTLYIERCLTARLVSAPVRLRMCRSAACDQSLNVWDYGSAQGGPNVLPPAPETLGGTIRPVTRPYDL
jgi:hypothetical protein